MPRVATRGSAWREYTQPGWLPRLLVGRCLTLDEREDRESPTIEGGCERTCSEGGVVAHSGKEQHRDAQPGQRLLDASELSLKYRVFRMTQQERERVAGCLRRIDDARDTIERQQNPANRRVLRELSDAADAIYDILNGLEETD